MPQIPNIEILETPRYPAKGLRAESTRAVTGSVPSQWVGGRLFGASAEFFFFMKTTVTQKQKVKKLFRRLEMNRLSEGYKRAID